MGQLRNATTRDGGFREWRPNTVTVIQRIWPDQSTRAQRFRRVPFAPPSARADEAAARESFERGFAEARTLLRQWQVELGGDGTESPAPFEPLPRESRTARGRPRATPAKSGAQAKPVAHPKPHAPRARAKASAPLKDMLGFGDWSAEHPGASLTTPASAPPPAPREEADADVVRAETMPGLDELGQSIERAIERARLDDPPPPAAGGLEIEPGFEGSNAGPAMAPMAAPEIRLATPLAAAPTLPGGEIATLVPELERLGVPHDERPRVSAALHALAGSIEAGELTWPVLREGMAVLMSHPALARRGVPLLLRYFEVAA